MSGTTAHYIYTQPLLECGLGGLVCVYMQQTADNTLIGPGVITRRLPDMWI
jgi:hypothetical protein